MFMDINVLGQPFQGPCTLLVRVVWKGAKLAREMQRFRVKGSTAVKRHVESNVFADYRRILRCSGKQHPRWVLFSLSGDLT